MCWVKQINEKQRKICGQHGNFSAELVDNWEQEDAHSIRERGERERKKIEEKETDLQLKFT